MPRLSFSPSLSEDPDLPEFSRRHQKRHGHLDVQSQISHALADGSEDRVHRRRDYRYTLLVPRRKPLPPPVPIPRPPTPTRRRAPTPPPSLPRAPPPIPLQYRISALPLPSFTRRDPSDLLAIIRPKVIAVLKRLQAVFDRKDQLLDAPHDHRLALQRIGDKLEWILDNLDTNGDTWTRSQQQNVDWFCKEFGKIRFNGLGYNFARIVSSLVELEYFGYLDWVHV